MSSRSASASSSCSVAIVGGGPAGLMAAEVIAQAGMGVDVFDAMPSVGRKFLLAGKGGLNITHSEHGEAFLSRYGARRSEVQAWLEDFGPEALCDWVHALGITTFVGSSGRVFPSEMKAAPLLRSWLHRLRKAGVRFHMRHRWQGWTPDGAIRLATPTGEIHWRADAVVLALGGGSWPRLGSDGAWVPLLTERAVDVSPLLPSNCGFDVAGRDSQRTGWSEHLRTRFAGQPMKSVELSFAGAHGVSFKRRGEFVITETGIEGSLVYAASALLRDEIGRSGSALVHLDLMPDWGADRVAREVAHPRGSRSVSSHLQSRLGLKGVKVALLHEVLSPAEFADPRRLAECIKALPLRLAAARPIEEAISSAGGVRLEALDERLMLRELPGVFCAGEMLDWEAPTGGYLLTASMASGRVAGQGVAKWLGVASGGGRRR